MSSTISNLRINGDCILNQLKKLPFGVLVEKNGVMEDKVMPDGRNVKFHVLVNRIDQRTISVIVQGFLKLKWFPLLKNSFADGFKMDQHGNVSDLESTELYDYS